MRFPSNNCTTFLNYWENFFHLSDLSPSELDALAAETELPQELYSSLQSSFLLCANDLPCDNLSGEVKQICDQFYAEVPDWSTFEYFNVIPIDNIANCSTFIEHWNYFELGNLTSDTEFNAIDDALNFPSGLLDQIRAAETICQRCSNFTGALLVTCNTLNELLIQGDTWE